MEKENGVEKKSGASTTDASQSEAAATAIDFNKPDELVGKTLDGRFVIQKNLTDIGGDAGGIGVVYLATDSKLMGKEVVVKILQESALKFPDIIRKFQHEKEALIRLDHPGIVRILDTGTLRNGNPFMVMGYIKGYSLRKPMRGNKQLPFDVVAHVIESVTDALSAAHSEKILHRDIKPENIMLTPQEEGMDRVRLIDFGIARVEESKLAPATDYSRAIGSVLYIAPEQLIGNLDLTPAADIFATAIVAYEMLTGELPFKPKAIAEMYQLEKEGVKIPPSTLRPDLPRVAEKILLSALEFDPEKRPQNARAFGRYLASELMVDEATDLFLASIKTEYVKFQPSESDPELEPSPAAEPKPFSFPVSVATSNPDPEDFQTIQRPNNEIANTPPTGKKPIKWGIVGAVALVVLLIPAAFIAWMIVNSSAAGTAANTNAIAADRTLRQLTYFLMVQKMRDGKPFEAPFKSSGQEIFESGYKFKMNFQSEASGFMYVFNEGKDASGKVVYSLIFPTPSVNRGTPAISAGQQIETLGNEFTGARGTEVMWLIWTDKKREDLDKIVQSAADSGGSIKDPANMTLFEDFLNKYKADERVVTKDSANKQTIIKGSGDVVVHRFELEHQ